MVVLAMNLVIIAKPKVFVINFLFWLYVEILDWEEISEMKLATEKDEEW